AWAVAEALPVRGVGPGAADHLRTRGQGERQGLRPDGRVGRSLPDAGRAVRPALAGRHRGQETATAAAGPASALGAAGIYPGAARRLQGKRTDGPQRAY